MEKYYLKAEEVHKLQQVCKEIIFSDFNANSELDDALFEFNAPAGVDIIGLDE